MSNSGSDLSCVDDCTPDFAEVSGRTCHAQAIARRYKCPRGRLIDDANYGYDLTQYVNDDLSVSDIARIQAGAEAEAKKDERTLECKVKIGVSVAGLMVVTVVLTDADGPFTLVISVSAVTVQLLSVTK
jgi:hypothetical protein